MGTAYVVITIVVTVVLVIIACVLTGMYADKRSLVGVARSTREKRTAGLAWMFVCLAPAWPILPPIFAVVLLRKEKG